MSNNATVAVTFIGSIADALDGLLRNKPTKLAVGLESEADLDGTPLPAVKYKGVPIEAVTIRFSKKAKRVTLARYLCGKIIFRPEEVTREDLLIMYDNFLHIQDLASKNENFRFKFGEDLESLAKILKGFRVASKTSGLSVQKLGAQMKEKLSKFYLPERNLSTVAEHVKNYYSLHPMRSLGTPTKELPPKAYIGKGYTDQGTARDPAYDGSPSWQEITAAHIGEEANGE